MPRIFCPECDAPVRIHEDDERVNVRCRSCGAKFPRIDRRPRETAGSSAMPWIIAGSIGGGLLLIALIVVLIVTSGPSDGDNPVAVADPEMTRLLEQVGNRDPNISRGAAFRLATMRPDVNQPAVARKLAGLIDTPDASTRQQIVRALSVWATPNEVPALIKCLDDRDISVRKSACDGLARVPDKRAAAPLAKRIADIHTRSDADRALRAIGTPAEPVMISLLKSNRNDVFAVRTVVDWLRDHGTSACIQPLQDVIADDNIHIRVHVRGSAQAALNAVKTRT